MNSRERILANLRRERTDRIPIDFWASRGAIASIERHFGLPYERFLDESDVDFRYIKGPHYIGPALDRGCDIWGVGRTRVHLSLPHGADEYAELQTSPLADAQSAADVDAYPGWPSPDEYDYSVVKAQCEAILARDRVAVFMGDRMNRVAQLKPAMYLRGIENILVDMAMREDIAEAIFHKIRQFYLVYLERILDAADGLLDIILTGDDFGSQNGLLLSVDMWRTFLRPGFKNYLSLIRQAGAASMHHTCGSVAELIPDMIESGLGILQSLQPEARGMELDAIMQTFGDALRFQGGISIQNTMPFGTVADVREAVRRVAAIAKPHGGYIFCTAHNIQADTPPANIRALIDAYHAFG